MASSDPTSPSSAAARRAARFRANAKPLPESRQRLPFARSFTADEFAIVRAGLDPARMEDKWILYMEDDVLRCVRSWTGFCIFEVPFLPTADGGAKAMVAWVNRDPAQYTGNDGYDSALLTFLIDNLLLGHDGPFPLPAGEKPSPVPGAGLFQHHIAGTGYPELELTDFYRARQAAGNTEEH